MSFLHFFTGKKKSYNIRRKKKPTFVKDEDRVKSVSCNSFSNCTSLNIASSSLAIYKNNILVHCIHGFRFKKKLLLLICTSCFSGTGDFLYSFNTFSRPDNHFLLRKMHRFIACKPHVCK